MATVSTKRKKCVLTFQKKLTALERLDKGESIRKIAKDMGVGRVTVCDWKRNRQKIEEWCSKSYGISAIEKRCRMQEAENSELDKALFLWFVQQQQDKGCSMSRQIIKEKALSLNLILGGDVKFAASHGWLDRWKSRHGITQFENVEGNSSVNETVSARFKNFLKQLIKTENLTDDQIFNCTRTNLFHKLLPFKTVVSKSEAAAKMYQENKEFLTILSCHNISNTIKLPLIVIGQSKKPMIFKNLDPKSFPIFYKYQKNTWIDDIVFTEWFKLSFVPNVQCFLRNKGLSENAILIMDYAPYHLSSELKIDNIRVIFSPTNVPSFMPSNQNILNKLIQKYRQKQLLEFVNFLKKDDNIISYINSIQIKDVIYRLAESWEDMNSSSFNNNQNDDIEENDKETSEIIDAALICINKIKGCESINKGNITDWIREDNYVEHTFSDMEIIEIVKEIKSKEISDSDDDDDANNEKIFPVSHNTASNVCETLLNYLEQQTDTNVTELMLLRKIKYRISQKRTFSSQQKTIKSFFK